MLYKSISEKCFSPKLTCVLLFKITPHPFFSHFRNGPGTSVKEILNLRKECMSQTEKQLWRMRIGAFSLSVNVKNIQGIL